MYPLLSALSLDDTLVPERTGKTQHRIPNARFECHHRVSQIDAYAMEGGIEGGPLNSGKHLNKTINKIYTPKSDASGCSVLERLKGGGLIECGALLRKLQVVRPPTFFAMRWLTPVPHAREEQHT